MTTKPYVVLQMKDQDYYENQIQELHFPDVDGSHIWHLTDDQAKNYARVFTDYHSPLYDKSYVLAEVVESVGKGREVVEAALDKLNEHYAAQAAKRKREQEAAEKRAETKRLNREAAKLLKTAKTKEELYKQLKEEFEGGV